MNIQLPIKSEVHEYRLKTVAHGYELQYSTWNKTQQDWVKVPSGEKQWKFSRFYPTIEQAAKGIWKEHLVNQCDTLEELRKEQGLFIDMMSGEIQQ